MPRLTREQWDTARAEWEIDPTVTMESVAIKFGVDKSQVGRIAKRDGWSKRGQLGDINNAAQLKADARCDSDGNSTQPKLNRVEQAKRAESEDLRAEVLIRHRAEWAELEGFRKVALAAMKAAHQAGDKESWTVAKMSAETARHNLSALEIKQTGERRSWGLEQNAVSEIVIGNPRKFDAS